MSDNADANMVVKYSAPRNKDVPQTSLAELLTSVPLARGKDGNILGDRVALSTRHDAPQPRSVLLPPGILYQFEIGMLYVYDRKRSEAEWLFEASRTAWSLVIPGLAELAGPLSHIVEEGAKAVLEDAAERAEARRVAVHGDSIDEAIQVLNKRGMVFLPGVDLVEAEYQVEPRRWFGKEKHRLILTHENPDGERMSHSMYWDGTPTTRQNLTSYVNNLFTRRWNGEYSYFRGKLESEQIGNDAMVLLALAFINGYKTQYGDRFENHLPELYADLHKAYNTELERKGFTPRRIAEAILEKFAPMIPYYTQVPALNHALTNEQNLAVEKT